MKLGAMLDLKGKAGFNFDAKAEYKISRTYIADGWVWAHVLVRRCIQA